MVCPECKGYGWTTSGYDLPVDRETCSRCLGAGHVDSAMTTDRALELAESYLRKTLQETQTESAREEVLVALPALSRLREKVRREAQLAELTRLSQDIEGGYR